MCWTRQLKKSSEKSPHSVYLWPPIPYRIQTYLALLKIMQTVSVVQSFISIGDAVVIREVPQESEVVCNTALPRMHVISYP